MSYNKQAEPEEWRPVRTHAVLRPIRRGPGKAKRFIGQQEDEKLRRVVRKHPIFYAGAAVPLLLALLFLCLVIWAETAHALPESSYAALDLISVLALILTALYGIYRIFEIWWVTVYIITDKR